MYLIPSIRDNVPSMHIAQYLRWLTGPINPRPSLILTLLVAKVTSKHEVMGINVVLIDTAHEIIECLQIEAVRKPSPLT
jgi:hypothetical protein